MLEVVPELQAHLRLLQAVRLSDGLGLVQSFVLAVGGGNGGTSGKLPHRTPQL